MRQLQGTAVKEKLCNVVHLIQYTACSDIAQKQKMGTKKNKSLKKLKVKNLKLLLLEIILLQWLCPTVLGIGKFNPSIITQWATSPFSVYVHISPLVASGKEKGRELVKEHRGKGLSAWGRK